MGDAPTRRGKSRGAPADSHSRDPYPATNLPPAGALGELSDLARVLCTVAGRINGYAEVWAGARRDARSKKSTARDRNESRKRMECTQAAIRAEVTDLETEAKGAALEAELRRVAELQRGAASGVVREDEAPPFITPEGSTPN